jgi:hypothetical protein
MRKRQKLAKVLFSIKNGTAYTIRGPKSHRPILIVIPNTDAFTRKPSSSMR